MINEALQPKENDDPDYCIPCFDCNTHNKVTARRCIGVHEKKRCDHYFEWKECHKCFTENDIVSRLCRNCGIELIDPNKKLKAKAGAEPRYGFDIVEGKYWILEGREGKPIFHAKYKTTQGQFIYESFMTKNDLCCNIFYGRFVKAHVIDASKYYPHLNNIYRLRAMLESGDVVTPFRLECVIKEERYRIVKRIFTQEAS